VAAGDSTKTSKQTPRRSGSAKGLKAAEGVVSKKTKPHRFKHILFKDWCKACGICVAFCPKGVVGQDPDGTPVFERPQDCIGCRFCEFHCPDFAITVQEACPVDERQEP